MAGPVRYDLPLLHGRLVRRYKRFLADVELDDGRALTVHCPNSGAMTSCMEPGCDVVLSDSNNPKRKLRYTWELSRMGRTWVGVHSARANHWAAHFIQSGAIKELQGYSTLERERTYGRHRLDIRLSAPDRPQAWVEVKFCTLRVGHRAAFPDGVSERGRRHLETLAGIAESGQRAVALFLVGRNDCEAWRPADEIDPAYGRALRQAVDTGVELLVYRLRMSPKGAELVTRLPAEL